MNAGAELLQEAKPENLAPLMEEYAEIIARDTAKPKDRERLEELMGKLGISREDLKSDLAAVKQVKDYRASLKESGDTSERYEERRRTLDKLTAEIEEAIKRLDGLRRQKDQVWGDGQQRSQMEAFYGAEIARVERENPRIAGRLPAVPAPTSGRVRGGAY